MEKIKFKARNTATHIDSKHWVYFTIDDLLSLPSLYFNDQLTNEDYCILEHDPSTRCQYVGLKDKNNKEIYEGDILEHCDEKYLVRDIVPLDRTACCDAKNLSGGEDSDDWVSMADVDWEIIGNIYENKNYEKE